MKSTIEQINDLIIMARRWREWEEKQITGQNDEFLISELEERIETEMLPYLYRLTKNDNEYFGYGSQIWDEVTILTLEIKKKTLEQKIVQTKGHKSILTQSAAQYLHNLINRILGY